MSIQTGWRAASPQEIESEILEPQENVLQGLPGLEQMDGNAGQGGALINLTFAVGTDMTPDAGRGARAPQSRCRRCRPTRIRRWCS